LRPSIITQNHNPIPELKKCPSAFMNTAPVSQRKAAVPVFSNKKASSGTPGARFNVVRKSQILGKKSVVQKMNDYTTHASLVSPMNQTLILSSQGSQFFQKSKSNPRGGEVRYTTLDGQTIPSHGLARVRAMGMKK